MTNQVSTVGAQVQAISTVFAEAPIEDLSAGIRAALARISLEGGIFGIAYRKERYELPHDQRLRIEVVVLKGSPNISKAYWVDGYEKGADKTPDCWSSNGKVPDQQVETPVSKTCPSCPMDAFRTYPNGRKGKECGDAKRIAVVPATDIVNEGFGGPMLIRVPAGSLGALEMYGKNMKKLGVPFYAYTTIISMVPGETTKLEFAPGRPLTDDEAYIVLAHRADERTGRIVNEGIELEETETGTPPVQQAAPPPAQARPQVIPQAIPQQVTPRVTPVAEKRATAAEPEVTRVVGGFAATTRPATNSPIAAAIHRPATPPPSQRQVQTEQQDITSEEVGEVPDEVEALFKEFTA